MITRFVLAVLSLSSLGSLNALAAAEIGVPSDYPTVAAAIDAAAPFDVITIAAGIHIEHNIDLQGKTVTIQGEIGPDGTLATTLDAQGQGAVFLIQSGETSDTVIRYLRMTGGTGYLTSPIRSGGGLFIFEASPSIIGCEISGNSAADLGGGIAIVDSSPRIIDCTVSNNTSDTGGGIYFNTSTTMLSGSVICGNLPDQQYVYESSQTGGNNTITDICPGPVGDLNGDGLVNQADLDVVRVEAGLCRHDIDGNGRTDVDDLLILLSGFGTTCP